MTINITSNKKNLSAAVHLNANATIVVTGNSTAIVANSTISSIAISDENLTGATITQTFAGCDGTGHIRIERGGEVVAIYDSTGWYDYAGSGMSMNVNKTANVNVTFVGSSNCYVFFELQKEGTFTSEYLVG